MNKLKVGIVGMGIMGELYARVYSQHPATQLTALCTRTPAKLKEAAAKFGVKAAYTDCSKMLAEADIDVVCVATPDHLHYDPVKQALKAGKHVIVEKPFTTSLREADELVKLATVSKSKLMVTYSHRWLPAYHQAYASIQKGEIGKPLMGYARKNDTIFVATDYIKWAAQSSPVFFLTAHDADLMRWYFNSEPVEAFAWGRKEVLVKQGIDTYDIIQGMVKFQNGCFATFESGWVYPNTFPTLTDSFVEVIGTQGHIHLDRKSESIEMSTPKAFTYPKTFLYGEIFGRVRGAFQASLDHFIECIQEDKTPAVTATDGRQVTAILDGIHRSLASGKVEKIS